MKETYTYSLRVTICPDFYTEEKFRELLEFCKEAQIDDIQFFVDSEEINQGHPTEEELKPWLRMLAGFKPQVEDAGMTMSLNPWTTTLHMDRGRKLKKGQNFTTMTDRNGTQAKAVACPLDSNFQKYIKKTYGMYAELGFNTIWVEDDFRLHNHTPLEWGGCFCDLHMKKFSAKAKKELDRTEFADGVVCEGEPHPYRKIWLDSARYTMNSLASVIGEAVHEKAPQTRIGLMSSVPEVHCIEGRDWKQIFANLSGDTRPLNRPHLPAYGEGAARQYAIDFQKISRLSAAITGEIAQLWPELDNLPHTTFSKSHRFARLEMESTLALGAEGITINIFDMIGNGISPRQKNEKMLKEIKPYLQGVRNLDYKGSQERGVCVMYSDKSSYTVHANGKKNMDAIQPCETFWAEYLGVFGIAYRYCDDSAVKGEIVAVSGQYFRNLTKRQIETLFYNNIILLEGEAAETLYDMGLGHLAGIETCEWYALNGGRHSYEQVAGDRIVQELPEARISAQSIAEWVETGDYLHITYSTENRLPWTLMKAPNGTTAGDGLTVVADRVIIFPYGHMRNQYYFLLNPVRQELFRELLLSQKGVELPAVVRECQYVTANYYEQEGKNILLLINYATDDFEDVEISVPCEVHNVYEISRDHGIKIPMKFETTENGIILQDTLEHMTSRCLIIE